MDNYGYNRGTQTISPTPNIFRSFLYALMPTKYDRLINVKAGSTIGFVFLLVLIVTLVNMTVFGIRYCGEFDKEFPEILILRDGSLYIEEEYVLDEGTRYLLVTDRVNGFCYEDVKEMAAAGYRQIWLVGRDNMVAFQYPVPYKELYFADLVGNGKEIRVKDALRVISYIAIACVTVIFYIGGVLWYFLCSTVLLVIGLIAARLYKRALSAEQIFRIAIYSQVLVYVAAMFVNVCTFMHWDIPNFIKAAITVLFLIGVIRLMPQTDENPMGRTGNPYGPASF